jgi:hypothetical protein
VEQQHWILEHQRLRFWKKREESGTNGESEKNVETDDQIKELQQKLKDLKGGIKEAWAALRCLIKEVRRHETNMVMCVQCISEELQYIKYKYDDERQIMLL